MAEATQNSFSELIENFVILQNNAFLVLEKISESVTSEADSISFTLTDVDDKTDINYTIPTYNYITREMERVDANIKVMLGLGDGNTAEIRNADGTYSTIYKATLKRDPEAIDTVAVPGTFKTKPNWFFEDYLNPILYVPIDVSKYVNRMSKRIKVKRMLINCTDKLKQELFDTKLKGRNNVTLSELLDFCNKNGITYINDEDVRDLSISKLAYTGKFDVLDIQDVSSINSKGITETIRWYKLNKLTYSDTGTDIINTHILSIGNELLLNETLYKVIQVDTSLTRIALQRISGYDGITKGATLEFYSDVEENRNVEVGIGYGEREVIFFKSINDDTNVISGTWSKGIAFNSNELTINVNGTTYNLADYYQKEVYDFGAFIKGELREDRIPALDGLTPNAPVLNASSFKVIQVNAHLYNTDEINEITSDAKDKISTEQSMQNTKEQIQKLKNILANTEFSSVDEKTAYEKDLAKYNEQFKSESALYSSLVKKLNAKAIDEPASLADPEYRVRGFFDMPKPVYTESTGTQEVVQFEIAYQYLSVNNTPATATQLSYVGDGNTKTGSFTNWTFVKSRARNRKWDEESQTYVWADVDTTNSEIENPNQIDIPITKGEKVEIKVRSISEAGWPTNPIYSEWCSPIIIDFPSEFTVNSDAKTALSDISIENSRVLLQEDIQSLGISEHISDSIQNGDRYFSHTSDTINSGFFGEGGIILSLYEKIKQQDDTINYLLSKINEVKPVMKVTLVDSEGNTWPIENGTVTSIFAGYYTEEQSKQPTAQQAGYIVTKNYYLTIENERGSNLELCSKYPGTYDATFEDMYEDEIKRDEFNNRLKYNKVPQVYTINYDEVTDGSRIKQTCYQSPQLLSQFIYGRYTDISGMKTMYMNSEQELMAVGDTSTTNTGIWAGFDENGEILTNGVLTDFCVHADCPILTSNTSQWRSYEATSGVKANSLLFTDPKAYFEDSTKVKGNGQLVPAFMTDENFYKQCTDNIFSQQTWLTSYKYPTKLGFYQHDRYLVGKKSCGSYLYVALSDYDANRVDGVDYLATRTLSTEDNPIQIPIIFEYRMQDYYNRSGLYGGYDLSKGGNASSYKKDFSYKRRLGFDISIKGKDDAFKFDIEFTAKCEKTTTADKVSTTTKAKASSYSRKLTTSYIKSTTKK